MKNCIHQVKATACKFIHSLTQSRNSYWVFTINQAPTRQWVVTKAPMCRKFKEDHCSRNLKGVGIRWEQKNLLRIDCAKVWDLDFILYKVLQQLGGMNYFAFRKITDSYRESKLEWRRNGVSVERVTSYYYNRPREKWWGPRPE